MRSSGGVLGLLCVLGVAHAHVAPDPNLNNRYAKLTVLGGTVRVAYTVFFGDRPGAGERRRMDLDGDGVISDTERSAFGARVLADVTPSLHLEVDGAPTPAPWKVADVGLGTPTVSAGALSVDLVVVAPLPDPTLPEHSLRFEDAWQAPLPGEEEIRIEESPGVHLLTSHLAGAARGLESRLVFLGNPHGERIVEATFSADPDLRVAPKPVRRPWWPWVLAGMLSAAFAAWLGRRVRVNAKDATGRKER